jgi:GT2 family glycosyltransferase
VCNVVANTRNVGYARAMNLALGRADAEVLIAWKPDTEPPPGLLAPCLLLRAMARAGYAPAGRTRLPHG